MLYKIIDQMEDWTTNSSLNDDLEIDPRPRDWAADYVKKLNDDLQFERRLSCPDFWPRYPLITLNMYRHQTLFWAVGDQAKQRLKESD